MKKTLKIVCLGLSIFSRAAYADDSGVLVSSSASRPEAFHAAGASANADDNSSPGSAAAGSPGSPSSAVDDIVAKSTDAFMFEMTANMELTPEQISAIRPIVEDSIAKTRALQQKLRAGQMDGKTMVRQKEQLTDEEERKLSAVLTPDQIKIWLNLQGY